MQYQKITRSDTTFTALILLMVLGKVIWLLLGVDHPMVEFPYSIPVYFSVGILMEILLHLIPIVLLVWLISNVILRKRWENKVFWTVAILFSLIEPIGQTIGMQQMGIITRSLFAGILFIFIFAANLLPLYLFRIYGFLSAVVWRLSFYLIWHIIWSGIYC